MSSAATVQRAWHQACRLLSQSRCSAALAQPHRTTVVVRRSIPPRQAKVDRSWGPFRPNLKRREMIYQIEEVRTMKPQGDMQLILTVDVEGIGFAGEVVTVTKRVGRNFLLPARAAEYVTDENMAKWEAISKDLPASVKQSVWARKTMRKLSAMSLPIGMHATTPWTLSPTHVKVAFRKQGVQLTEDNIQLPQQPITEFGDITLQVNVNKADLVEVRAVLYALDPEYPDAVPGHLPPVWEDTALQLGEAVLQAVQKARGGDSGS